MTKANRAQVISVHISHIPCPFLLPTKFWKIVTKNSLNKFQLLHRILYIKKKSPLLLGSHWLWRWSAPVNPSIASHFWMYFCSNGNFYLVFLNFVHWVVVRSPISSNLVSIWSPIVQPESDPAQSKNLNDIHLLLFPSYYLSRFIK